MSGCERAGKGLGGGSRQRWTQVAAKAVPEGSPEGHQDPHIPVCPRSKSRPASGRAPRAAGPHTGQGGGFLAPPTSEQSEENRKKTSETPSEEPEPEFTRSPVI